MPVVVECAHCGQHGEVSRSAAGFEVQCAVCKRPFRVPLEAAHVTVEWGVGYTGLRAPLTPGKEFRIGRAPDNQLVLGGEKVSRHHAVVRLTDDGWQIEDLGSANGTTVDGQRIKTAILANRSRFSIGDCVLRVTLAVKPSSTGPTALDELALQESHYGGPQTIIRPISSPPPRPQASTSSSSADTMFAGPSISAAEIMQEASPHAPETVPAVPRPSASSRFPGWLLLLGLFAIIAVAGLVAWIIFTR